MQRRRFLVAAPVVASAAVLTVTPAWPIAPAVLAIYLSLIAAGGTVLASKIAADRSAHAQIESTRIQAAIERMRQEFSFRMMVYQMGSSPVQQETAYDQGAPARQGWTDDVDGQGTYLGLAAGRIAVERGKFRGTICNAELAKFCENTRKGEAMPVPVEDGYHSYSTAEADRVRDLLGRRIGLDARLVGGRRYGLARSPTTAGWDLESVIYADANNEVKAANVVRARLYAG